MIENCSRRLWTNCWLSLNSGRSEPKRKAEPVAVRHVGRSVRRRKQRTQSASISPVKNYAACPNDSGGSLAVAPDQFCFRTRPRSGTDRDRRKCRATPERPAWRRPSSSRCLPPPSIEVGHLHRGWLSVDGGQRCCRAYALYGFQISPVISSRAETAPSSAIRRTWACRPTSAANSRLRCARLSRPTGPSRSSSRKSLASLVVIAGLGHGAAVGLTGTICRADGGDDHALHVEARRPRMKGTATVFLDNHRLDAAPG